MTEREVLRFVTEKQSYFVIASLLKAHVDFGHHEAYLFPEFQLGNSYKVDYPKGEITVENGDLGKVFRKGLTQVADWSRWLEAR